MQQCRRILGQGNGKGVIGEQAEGRGLMGLLGRGSKKGEIIRNVNKEYI